MNTDDGQARATAGAPTEEPVPEYLAALRVDGRSFVVAGAGQGMGRQACHALAQAGARAILCVDVDAARAEVVAAEIGVGVPCAVDATTTAGCETVAAAAAELPGLCGLVDVIGRPSWGGILSITQDDWARQYDLNLRHAVLLSQHMGRLLGDRALGPGDGTMVFVSSVSALSAAPQHAAYGALKAALSAWVRSLAVELGPLGIRANAVAPGAIATPRTAPLIAPADVEAYAALSPLGRMGTTADIAGAALFLSSPLSAYVTGVTLVVDGGIGSTFRYAPASTNRT